MFILTLMNKNAELEMFPVVSILSALMHDESELSDFFNQQNKPAVASKVNKSIPIISQGHEWVQKVVLAD